MIYEPSEDSRLLVKEVTRYSLGKKVLDMCSGSGIIAQAALRSHAASVLAIDIDKESITYLKQQGILAIQSDLFKNAKGKYDLIACNPPYLPKDTREDPRSSKATSGGKNGDELILRFLKQAPRHLEKDGIILLVLSSLTPRKKIDALLKRLKLEKEVIASESFFMEALDVWKIAKVF